MKTRKAVLAGGLMAGLAALPLSASADTTAAPAGSATAATVSLKVSLQPLINTLSTASTTVNGATGQNVDPLAQLSAAFETLKSALCSNPTGQTPPVGCDISIPSSLPNSLTVNVAQANATATFNDTATDVAGGKSSATPVTTDWDALNVDISALETELTNLIQGDAASLASGGLAGLNTFLTSNSPGNLKLTSPIGTAEFNILGSVAAALNQAGTPNTPVDTANAVKIQVTNDPTGTGALQNAMVSVDPFTADAVNAASAAANGVKGPEVSAANTSVGLNLPDLLVNTAGAASLANLQSELKSLVDALTNAIANPSQAGNILSNVPDVPPALQTELTTIGGLVNQTLAPVAGAAPVSTAVDLTALKALDTNLSAALSGVTQLSAAIAGLPNVSNLLTSTADIATAKTSPLAGGGVDSTATATLGALDVLPIGDALAGLVSKLGLPGAVTAKTPLLSIQGITSTAHAAVGPGTSSPTGSGGLKSISILGQPIDLESALHLTNGTSQTTTIGIPGLGANGGTGYLTLVISEGIPNTIIDTASSRAIDMATLDVELINGCAGSCANAVTLDTLTGAAGTLTGGAATANTASSPKTASTSGSQTGVQQLGNDGDVVRLAVSDTTAAASMNGIPQSSNQNQVESVTSLPKTGMFGGAGLFAGLGLVGVAISLRVVPSLRNRSRRVR